MLKRLWVVLAFGWMLLFLYNGFSKEGGIRSLDVMLAFAPITISRIVGFIVNGAPR